MSSTILLVSIIDKLKWDLIRLWPLYQVQESGTTQILLLVFYHLGCVVVIIDLELVHLTGIEQYQSCRVLSLHQTHQQPPPPPSPHPKHTPICPCYPSQGRFHILAKVSG